MKRSNRQEHVTEYGVHWNFFVTLGVLPIIVTVQSIVIPQIPLLPLGFAVAIGYQALLGHYGLEDYILNAPRDGIISMNREGLCSLLGTPFSKSRVL